MPSVMPLPLMHQTPNLQLVLYAPDNRHMARLGSTLSGHAQLTWVDSREVSPQQLAKVAAGAPLVLLDYCGGNAGYSSDLARQLAAAACPLPMVGVGTEGPEQAHHLLVAVRAGVRDFIDIDNNAPQMLEVFERITRLPLPSPTAATLPSKTCTFLTSSMLMRSASRLIGFSRSARSAWAGRAAPRSRPVAMASADFII